MMSILLVYKKPRLENLKTHEACLKSVENLLKSKGFQFETCFREDLSLKSIQNQLIITVGGDGTVLDASHYLKDNVILGVNSNPTISVGSLCVAQSSTFEEVFTAYQAGKLKPISVMRMQLKLNGKLLPVLALNDVLIATQNPAAMTRYLVKVGEKKVFHKNSGLWICTPCGSTGAVCSTGGRVQKIDDNRLQWVCREPYFAKLPVPVLMTGFLLPEQSIILKSCMQEGRIYIDGPHWEQEFEEGAELILSASGSYLNCLMTPEMESRRQQIGLLRENYKFERK